ncbi:MAG: hypothetical protein HeimC2_25670 [Candidatus Heimdallarchaeota archaeon LC_2]|nr:MAG: hypothetical protein HeimC2_25670 [Candidatus Heimdallarchaeota archaeon LC_2]
MDYKLPLNKYHIRASHNTFGVKFFWDNASNIKYIPDFLNAGFRALEVDVYYDRKKRIRVGHHGLNLSFSRSNFKEYLMKIQEWRLSNSNHLPILIQIEANDPEKQIKLVEHVFTTILSVFPEELLVGPKEISDFRTNNSGSFWPEVDSLRSRLIFNIQMNALKAYHKQKDTESDDLSNIFFGTQDNEFFADYSYLEVGDDTDKANSSMKLLKDDIKKGKLVRVSPSYKFTFFRKKIMNVKDCMEWGVNIIAVDKKSEDKDVHHSSYMEIN